MDTRNIPGLSCMAGMEEVRGKREGQCMHFYCLFGIKQILLLLFVWGLHPRDASGPDLRNYFWKISGTIRDAGDPTLAC